MCMTHIHMHGYIHGDNLLWLTDIWISFCVTDQQYQWYTMDEALLYHSISIVYIATTFYAYFCRLYFACVWACSSTKKWFSSQYFVSNAFKYFENFMHSILWLIQWCAGRFFLLYFSTTIYYLISSNHVSIDDSLTYLYFWYRSQCFVHMFYEINLLCTEFQESSIFWQFLSPCNIPKVINIYVYMYMHQWTSHGHAAQHW